MTIPTYKPSEYITYILNSKRKHLLVEGTTDKRLFHDLLDELKHTGVIDVDTQIDIDSAEILVNFDPPAGNREKVEQVCQQVTGKSFESRFVGFVDREFREFDLETVLQDKLKCHKVDGRLVWSRGHSIENYCFEFPVLRTPLRDMSTAEFDHVQRSLALYESLFDDILYFACATSLAAHDANRADKVQSSIHWSVFDFSEGKFRIDFTKWREQFSRINVSDNIAKQVIAHWHKWYPIIVQSDMATVRWMCHGHIGFTTMWAAYAQCLVAKKLDQHVKNSKAAAHAKAHEKIRTNACMTAWIQGISRHNCEYPKEVLALLRIPHNS